VCILLDKYNLEYNLLVVVVMVVMVVVVVGKVRDLAMDLD
jgi:hypothetical protein